MKKIRLSIPWTLIVLCLLVVAIIWTRAFIYNQSLQHNFSYNGKGKVYEKGTSLSLGEIREISATIYGVDGFGTMNVEDNVVIEISVCADIHYYLDEECKNLFKTIDKGSKIILFQNKYDAHWKPFDRAWYYLCY